MNKEREEIFKTLSGQERKILYQYEKKHGYLQPGMILKVIEDQKELDRDKNQGKKGKKR